MNKVVTVRLMGIAAVLATGLCLGACTRREEPAAPAGSSAAPAEKSTSQTMIDGMTGKTAVNAGFSARRTITNVNARHTADVEELENF